MGRNKHAEKIKDMKEMNYWRYIRSDHPVELYGASL
jgi:hypothetical protein